VYPVVAALGVVALIVGLIGLAAVHATNREVRELEEVANSAFFATRASALIYAVVADSRGVYMSSEAADRANYGAGILKFLAELEANMAEWKEHVAPDDRESFARAQARADEFVRFRTECSVAPPACDGSAASRRRWMRRAARWST
jgi:methyl-accepting chemotaxis protein